MRPTIAAATRDAGAGVLRDAHLELDLAAEAPPGDLDAAVDGVVAVARALKAAAINRAHIEGPVAGRGRGEAADASVDEVADAAVRVVVVRYVGRAAVRQHRLPGLPRGRGAHLDLVGPARAAVLEEHPVGDGGGPGLDQGVEQERYGGEAGVVEAVVVLDHLEQVGENRVALLVRLKAEREDEHVDALEREIGDDAAVLGDKGLADLLVVVTVEGSGAPARDGPDRREGRRRGGLPQLRQLPSLV